jgi:hydrogenase nickel incorporation protein HypB
MCATCGCGDEAGVRVTMVSPAGAVVGAGGTHDHGPAPGHAPDNDHAHDGGSPHDNDHSHDDGNPHAHPHQQDGHIVLLERRVLAKNDLQAQRNRAWLNERRICVVNLMSAPGSGKTTLLERTIREVGTRLGLSVIEGDQETLLDAERIRATGCQVVQINTGAGCHLDAEMMERGLRELDPAAGSLVIVENVGNLVCPALFDLGETYRVVVTAVTEGADKPLKYPQMFRGADLVVLNKADLLPYLDVEVGNFATNVSLVNPGADLMTVSATRGDGMTAWYDRLAALFPGS